MIHLCYDTHETYQELTWLRYRLYLLKVVSSIVVTEMETAVVCTGSKNTILVYCHTVYNAVVDRHVLKKLPISSLPTISSSWKIRLHADISFARTDFNHRNHTIFSCYRLLLR